MMKKSEEKRLAAENYIDLELLKLSSGDFLPSRRQMQVSSGLGRNVIENALKKKIASGQIIALFRRGYCKNHLTNDIALINTLSGSLKSSYFHRLVKHLNDHAAARNIPTHLGLNELPLHCEEALKYIRRNNISRLFLLSEENSERINFFRSHNIPTVAILPMFTRNLGGSVRHSPKLIEMQLERLFATGCRRIAYINHLGDVPENYSFLLRRESFYRWMAERGHRVYPHHVCSQGSSNADFFDLLSNMFDTSPAPDAVICCTYRLHLLYKFLRSRSLRPMIDVIISADGIPERMPAPHPQLICNDPAEVAKLSWILMDRICNGQPGADKVLQPQWFFSN